jgi:predicted secreted protein
MIRIVQVDSTFNGRTVELSPGDELELALDEKTTAGFRWTLLSSGEPACALADEALESARHPPGAAARHRWRFTARSAGTGTIRLAYGRRWEPNGAQGFELGVRIKAPAP